jgi:hypothetical protein
MDVKEAALTSFLKRIEGFHADSDKNKSFYFDIRLALNAGIDDAAEIGLMYAIDHHHEDAIGALMQAGAKIDYNEGEPVKVAIENHNFRALKIMIEENADSLKYRHFFKPIAQPEFSLNKNIGQIDKEKVFDSIIESRRQDNEVHKALRESIEDNDMERLQHLHKEGFNIYADNDYLLRHAALNKRNDMVVFLADKGANVGSKDNMALKKAYMQNNLSMATTLISLGADYQSLLKYSIRNDVYAYVQALEKPVSFMMTQEQQKQKAAWLDNQRMERFLEVMQMLQVEKELREDVQVTQKKLSLREKFAITIQMREVENKQFKDIAEKLDVTSVRAHELYKAACTLRRMESVKKQNTNAINDKEDNKAKTTVDNNENKTPRPTIHLSSESNTVKKMMM